MNRFLLLAAAGLLACGRSQTTAPAKDRAAAETLLAHLPADTEAVVAGSLTELAEWPLWRRAVGVVAHELPGMAERIATRCQLDPWAVLDNAALAFSYETGTVLAAQTTFSRTRLHECVTKVGGDEQPITVEDGPITRYVEAESTEHAAWFGENVFLTVPERMDELSVIEPLAAPRPVPEDVKALLARADRGATVWGVATATANGAVTGMTSMIPFPSRPIGMHAALRRGNGLRAHIAFVFVDAKGATEAARLFESFLATPPPWLTPWREGLGVVARGDEARLTFELAADRAHALDDALIALLPKPSVKPPPTPAELAAPPQ